jgi:hypothetical protein
MAMLAWALWISFSLIGILRHGWKVYSEPVIWHSFPKGKGTSFFKRKKEEVNEAVNIEDVDLSADMKIEEEEGKD